MTTWLPKLLLLLGFAIVLGLPVAWRPETARAPQADARLVIITPHNEQIQHEFDLAFRRWYEQQFHQTVTIDWRRVGGSSDVHRLLAALYVAAARAGREDEGSGYDVVFGGGDYLFDRKLKPGVTVQAEDGTPRHVSMLQPIQPDPALVQAAFPTQSLAGRPLYDAEGHWWGVVLSSFGIVYNRDVLRDRGLPEPATWSDLCDPRYDGWLALADPAHSGSINTTYEAIVQRYGWERGWQTLRRVGANARYFASDASQVPIDVSSGEVAAGMCVDFYGRYQAGAVGGQRVGYVAPVGATVVNADPAAVLRGAPNRETAVRFIEFLLSEQGQLLWCTRKGDPDGPDQFELRRTPIRRDSYARHLDRMIDQQSPFDVASELPPGTPAYFDVMPVVYQAMAIDTHGELKQAWRAICAEQDESRRAQMLQHFDGLPFTQLGLEEARLRWKADPNARSAERLAWTKFFLKQYEEVLSLAGG